MDAPRRRLCRCAFGMAAAMATLQPDLLTEFEANHRPCVPGACVCVCSFCLPDGPPDEPGAGADESCPDGGDKRRVIVEGCEGIDSNVVDIGGDDDQEVDIPVGALFSACDSASLDKPEDDLVDENMNIADGENEIKELVNKIHYF